MTNAALDAPATAGEKADALIITNTTAQQLPNTTAAVAKVAVAVRVGNAVSALDSIGQQVELALPILEPAAVSAATGSATGIVGSIIDVVTHYSALRAIVVALVHDVEALIHGDAMPVASATDAEGSE